MQNSIQFEDQEVDEATFRQYSPARRAVALRPVNQGLEPWSPAHQHPLRIPTHKTRQSQEQPHTAQPGARLGTSGSNNNHPPPSSHSTNAAKFLSTVKVPFRKHLVATNCIKNSLQRTNRNNQSSDTKKDSYRQMHQSLMEGDKEGLKNSANSQIYYKNDSHEMLLGSNLEGDEKYFYAASQEDRLFGHPISWYSELKLQQQVETGVRLHRVSGPQPQSRFRNTKFPDQIITKNTLIAFSPCMEDLDARSSFYKFGGPRLGNNIQKMLRIKERIRKKKISLYEKTDFTLKDEELNRLIKTKLTNHEIITNTMNVEQLGKTFNNQERQSRSSMPQKHQIGSTKEPSPVPTRQRVSFSPMRPVMLLEEQEHYQTPLRLEKFYTSPMRKASNNNSNNSNKIKRNSSNAIGPGSKNFFLINYKILQEKARERETRTKALQGVMIQNSIKGLRQLSKTLGETRTHFSSHKVSGDHLLGQQHGWKIGH